MKVRELRKSGNEYPVNLDDVFPLLYSQRGKAVSHLRENFIENEDYLIISQTGKNTKGRNKSDYFLSVSAMEFFVAKKVKEVFAVYREVFHKTLDEAENVQPLSEIDLLVKSALALQAQERRLTVVEEKVNTLIEDKSRSMKMLTEIPFSLETGISTPELSLREKIRLLVNRISAATSTPQHDIWNNIYQTLYYNYGISIKSYKKEKKNESLLDVAERKCFLDKMFSIASKLVTEKIVA
ncbi:hypothetical protein [Chryseobacterium taichungense]|uniref:hypothetical protein n=1 Tax=Chryseobacterium taichungense TaxID=295069 RepID=UPI0028B0697B|nr:hypothetical protein [Chryseobacterium taichungense]